MQGENQPLGLVILALIAVPIGLYFLAFFISREQITPLKKLHALKSVKTAISYSKYLPENSKEVFRYFQYKAADKLNKARKMGDLYTATSLIWFGLGVAYVSILFSPPTLHFLIFLIFFSLISSIAITQYKKKKAQIIFTPLSFKIKKIFSGGKENPLKIPYKLKITPIGKAIKKLHEFLDNTDVPASISYHASERWGLRDHSLRVAKKAVKILKEKEGKASLIDQGLIYLMGLSHDLGKARIYKFQKEILKSPSEDPLGILEKKKVSGFKTVGLSDIPHTKIILNEILSLSGFSDKERENLIKAIIDYRFHRDNTTTIDLPEKLKKFAEIVIEADISVTNEELRKIKDKKVLETAFIESLLSLNINGIYGNNLDGWYNPEKDILLLIIFKLCNALKNYFEGRNLTQEFSATTNIKMGLPPIFYKTRELLMEKEMLITSIIKEDFTEVKVNGVVDAEIGERLFESVLAIKGSFIPPELKAIWTEDTQIYPFTLYPDYHHLILSVLHKYDKKIKRNSLMKNLNEEHKKIYEEIEKMLLPIEPHKRQEIVDEIMKELNKNQISGEEAITEFKRIFYLKTKS